MFRMNGTSRWSTWMCGAKRPCGLGRDFLSLTVLNQDTTPHWLRWCVQNISNVMPSACPEPGWELGARTVSDKDVATEFTGMYLQRVLAVNTHPGSPTDELSETAVGRIHFFQNVYGRLILVPGRAVLRRRSVSGRVSTDGPGWTMTHSRAGVRRYNQPHNPLNRFVQ